MGNLLAVANWLLPILYLALLIDYGAAFFLRSPRRGSSVWLPAVCCAHLAYLVLLAVRVGRPVPVESFEVLSVLAASTTAVYWVLEFASGERRTGVFVLLAVFLMQYTASVFLPGMLLKQGAGEPTPGPAGLHIIPSIIAYTALTISAIYGLLHLAARRDLKHHRFGLLFDRLPPLDLLGTMNWHAMLTGLVFMTLAIVSGAVAFAVAPHDPLAAMGAKVWTKIIAGSVAWLVYVSAAAGKWIGRWSAARVSLVTVVGFVVVVAMLVISIGLS
jgi:ABC-type uncharacterized transport system permease subunit